MIRDGDPDAVGQMVDLIAHAFSPVEWSGRWLSVVSVVFVAVTTLTVAQRALVADSATGWAITAIHGAIVLVVVPLLLGRTWREWVAARSES
jgi:hypothetical protein